tara:strand:- start:34 stop:2964 length:2931 start_codon:yes stop_codon:yes gene_type:complete
MDINQFRQQYPQYEKLDNQTLSDNLYNKFYSDKVSKEEFEYKFLGPTKVVQQKPDSGQLEIDIKAATQGDPLKKFALKTLDVNVPLIKGARDILSGLLQLPSDLMGKEEVSKKIDAAIPEIKVGETLPGLQEFSSVLVQYGLPATQAFKASQLLINSKKLKEAVPVLNKLKGKPQKILEYVAGLTGAALADFVVTNPQEAASLGDLVGGPTDIEEADSNIKKRAKVGAETLVAGPIADVVLSNVVQPAVSFTGNILDQIKTPFSKTKMQENVASNIAKEANVLKKENGKFFVDEPARDSLVNTLQENIIRAQEIGVKPTTGTISKNVGLIGLEKSLASKAETSGLFLDRKISNIKTLNQELDKLRIKPGASISSQDFVQATLKEKDIKIREAQDDLAEIINDLENSYPSGIKAQASIKLNKNISDELVRVTNQKNDLYKAIDPNLELKIDPNLKVDVEGIDKSLKEVLKEITSKKGKVDPTPARIKSLGFIRDLEKYLKGEKIPKNKVIGFVPVQKRLKPQKERQLSYGDLQNIRPYLSDAIRESRKDIKLGGAVAERLSQLKEVIDNLVEQVARRDDAFGQRARRAFDFYKNTFVPKFRTSVGNEFAQKYKQGAAAIPESQLASKFIYPNKGGALEAAENLKNIIEGSENEVTAIAAVRDYLITDLANYITGSKGQLIPKRIDKFIDNYQEILNRFPSIKKEIVQYKDKFGQKVKALEEFQKKFDNARGLLSDKTRLRQLTAAELFLNKNPVQAVATVLSSPNPKQLMQETLSFLKQDKTGDAIQGFKKAIAEYINQTTKGKSLPGDIDAYYIKKSAVEGLYNNPSTKEALELIYNPQEMKILKDVRDQLVSMDAINAQVISGSPTQPLQEANNRLRIVLASWYGIVKGRGVFAISNWVSKTLGFNPTEVAEKILVDAMLDPELAIKMLQEDLPKNAEPLSKWFKTYILNNVLADLSREPAEFKDKIISQQEEQQ